MQFPFTVPLGNGSFFTFHSFEHMEKTMRDFMKTIDTLESITFDPGVSGDLAMTTLQEIGVYSENLERIGTSKNS